MRTLVVFSRVCTVALLTACATALAQGAPAPATRTSEPLAQLSPARRSQDLSKAEAAASAWLSTVDAGHYAQSWSDAAPSFKSHGTQAEWTKAISAARKPLGAMKSRQLRSARLASQLPGAPRGEYAELLYDTSFANQSTDSERVTMARESDGKWKVVGYFIR